MNLLGFLEINTQGIQEIEKKRKTAWLKMKRIKL